MPMHFLKSDSWKLAASVVIEGMIMCWLFHSYELREEASLIYIVQKRTSPSQNQQNDKCD